jgi:hypothetical protein
MIRRVVIAAALLVSCTSYQQFLTSPCVDQAATTPGGACPPCTVDSDCQILNNLCQQSAFCVSKASNQVVSPDTCPDSEKWQPVGTLCGCMNSICQAIPNPK